ncbi:OmpA family protein [Rapidithrix thailandica]|uniref:OmpA family protein n=1 Tax=Rapidithrix thailandica TaxID=413964 RepID=A0AAW9S237_9BACT
MNFFGVLLGWGILSVSTAFSQSMNVKPLIPKLRSYNIVYNEQKADQLLFATGFDQFKRIEGNKTLVQFELDKFVDSRGLSSNQLIKNYESLVKKFGGGLVYQYDNHATFKVNKFQKSFYVTLETYGDGKGYSLAVVEAAMEPGDLFADNLLKELNQKGSFSLYFNFKSGTAQLPPDAETNITTIAEVLLKNPDLKISIEGHTDNVGSAEMNKRLSEQRANSVMHALIKKGVGAERLKAIGWGDEKPLASNTEESGRQKNRRVELIKI